MLRYIVAADTGGTFTDLAVYDREAGRVLYSKSLTTYDDLVNGVIDCVRKVDVDLREAELIKFGTTIVINTFVQRSGAKTALVTTSGFRDVLEIRRGNRSVPFDLRYEHDPILVERDMRFEVTERVATDGSVIVPLDLSGLSAIVAVCRANDVEAVAVSLINAYAASAHEAAVAGALREALPGVYVTAATELSGEWGEYERTSTAVANAYVGPTLVDYAKRLDARLKENGFARTFYLMASNGGVISVERAQRQPVLLVESGPVGGCIGAGVYADELGLEHVIAFDMGGTTAKCAVLDAGRFDVRSPYYVGGTERGFPIRGGVLDIIEVGTGGGSIAWFDAQQRLAVGPRSAGSMPGPACYGRGGTEATITDANLVLGRIGSSSFLGGEMTLDVAASERAIDAVAERLGLEPETSRDDVAAGILALATVSMASAIRQITIERGLDPREFPLVAFGGGGPLHASTLARELNIPEVIVPPEPGIFSALGMILADARVDTIRTFLMPLTPETVPQMGALFDAMQRELEESLQAELGATGVTFERQAEMRFQGQRHTIRTPIGSRASLESIRQSFETTYHRRYGFATLDAPAEFVSLVLTALAHLDRPEAQNLIPRLEPTVIADMKRSSSRPVYFAELRARVETPTYQRQALPIGFAHAGPAIIEEYGSTTVVGPYDRFQIGKLGEIRITMLDAKAAS